MIDPIMGDLPPKVVVPPKKMDLDGFLRRRVAPSLVESEVLVGTETAEDYLKILKASDESIKVMANLKNAGDILFSEDASHTFKEWMAIELEGEEKSP